MILILLVFISLILFCIWILKEYRERKSFIEKDKAFYRDLARWEMEEEDEKIRELHDTIRRQGQEIERLKRMMSYMQAPEWPGENKEDVNHD